MFAESARMAKSFDGYTVTDQEQRLKEVCKDFESMFFDQVFKTMRSATMESDLIKKSMGERIFTEMMDTEFSKEAANQSVNGIGDMLFDQMKKYLPSADHGNNFPNGATRDKSNRYNPASIGITEKSGNGINVAI
mgnify:CR=1 FL=1